MSLCAHRDGITQSDRIRDHTARRMAAFCHRGAARPCSRCAHEPPLPTSTTLVVTESAIDALSLAQHERLPRKAPSCCPPPVLPSPSQHRQIRKGHQGVCPTLPALQMAQDGDPGGRPAGQNTHRRRWLAGNAPQSQGDGHQTAMDWNGPQSLPPAPTHPDTEPD